MEKRPCVYIMTNEHNTVLYTDVTSNLPKRVYEHKAELADGFTKKYNAHKLVYYEQFEDMEQAIVRESRSRAAPGKRRLT